MASKQQTKLIKIWQNKGYEVVNIVSASRSFYPDLIATKPGHTVFIESKEKWDKLSEGQKIKARQLIKQGFEFYLNEKKYIPTIEKTDLF